MDKNISIWPLPGPPIFACSPAGELLADNEIKERYCSV
jgi:hypothetical protein